MTEQPQPDRQFPQPLGEVEERQRVAHEVMPDTFSFWDLFFTDEELRQRNSQT